MTWTPPQHEWEEMRGSLRRLGEEREDDRQMLRDLHGAVVGTTQKPGMAEEQRRQGEQLDRHDRRLGYIQSELETVKAQVTDLEQAPAKAAVAEVEARRQQTAQLRQTVWGKAVDVAFKVASTAAIAILSAMAAMGGALQALVQRTPPPPGT